MELEPYKIVAPTIDIVVTTAVARWGTIVVATCLRRNVAGSEGRRCVYSNTEILKRFASHPLCTWDMQVAD